jgi:hypothetical protein
VSKTTYQKQRTVSVLDPSGAQFSTMTYFYEPRGAERVDGLLDSVDLAIQADYRVLQKSRVGVKFDIFNLFNNEEKLNVSNLTWCNSTATASCTTAVNNFGKATSRAAFQAPRTYRVTLLFRY